MLFSSDPRSDSYCYFVVVVVVVVVVVAAAAAVTVLSVSPNVFADYQIKLQHPQRRTHSIDKINYEEIQ